MLFYNNDVATVQGRVMSQRYNIVPPGRYNEYLFEFLESIPLGEGVPWSIADVMEKQDGTLKKVRSEKVRQWIGYLPSMTVKAFQKKESYKKVTDPRNISTVHTSHTVYSSFQEECPQTVFMVYARAHSL